MNGDVMHGCGVTLKQSMQVSSTMSETENRCIIYTFHPVIIVTPLNHIFRAPFSHNTLYELTYFQPCEIIVLINHTFINKL